MLLNEKIPRLKYEVFEGIYSKAMEELIKDKRRPLTTEEIIERRVNSKCDDWKDNYFDTCDAIAIHPNGKFKIIKKCDILKKLNNETKLKDYDLVLSEKEYKKLKGKEFHIKNTQCTMINKELTSDEVLRHSVWNYLVNKVSLKKYTNIQKYDNFMGLYIYKSKEIVLRALYLDELDDRPVLYGGNRLGVGDSLLVGVANEMEVNKNGKNN